MSHKKAIFNLLNDFFDHIYLISLRRSKDRHPRIKKALEGLDYQIFWGVDGNQLNLDDLKKDGLYEPSLSKKTFPSGREMTKGEIGCALSHIEVYKDIIDRNFQNALILEDDLKINTTNSEELSQSFSELPENWDLLYLGYLYNNNSITFPIHFRLYIAYPILNFLGMEKYNSKKLKCKYPRPYSKHLELSGYHYGTHAYGVSQLGAKKILDYQTPILMPPDNAIGMMCMKETINAFRVKKRIFHQNRKEFVTTISGRN